MANFETPKTLRSLGQVLRENAVKYGALPAMRDLQRSALSYGELVVKMDEIRAKVARAGVPAGARVAV